MIFTHISVFNMKKLPVSSSLGLNYFFLFISLICSRALSYRFGDESIIANFPEIFDFGIATAPAHVEDNLHDSWLDWAKSPAKPPLIPFFGDIPNAERRLDFWSAPEEEIRLVKQLGVSTYRVGIDWGRLVPHKPGAKNCKENGYVVENRSHSPSFTTLRRHYLEKSNSFDQDTDRYPCRAGVQDLAALDRYVEILKTIHDADLSIILTFFHHSLPRWANTKSFRGWTNPQTIDYFLAFVSDVTPRVKHLVDRYVTLNEPAVFANLVYGVSMWPGRLHKQLNPATFLDIGFWQGDVVKAQNNMAEAHKKAYYLIKELDDETGDMVSPLEHRSALIGIAHNVALIVPGPDTNRWTKPVVNALVKLINYYNNMRFMDMVQDHLDYMGINYYGKEYVAMTAGIPIYDGTEYSESGRAVSPQGFYTMLKVFHQKYNVDKGKNMPILILENGISDGTDVIRRPYTIEHLMVLSKLMEEGLPIAGYHFWTISDNWEWADGYCPRFGLANVDRNTPNLQRTLRPSFFLFRDIVKTKCIVQKQRAHAWYDLSRRSKSKNPKLNLRPFCRAPDGISTVNEYSSRPYQNADWRFDYKL